MFIVRFGFLFLTDQKGCLEEKKNKSRRNEKKKKRRSNRWQPHNLLGLCKKETDKNGKERGMLLVAGENRDQRDYPRYS